MTQTTDPLHAYSGADRDLRNDIAQLCSRYISKVQYHEYVPGTLYLANDIMELVKAAKP